MDTKPRESMRKRVLHKFSKPFKPLIRSRGQESVERLATEQAQGSGSLIDLPDRPSSPPLGVPQESGQTGEEFISMLSVPALGAIRPSSNAIDPRTDLSVEPSASRVKPSAVTGVPPTASGPATPTSARGLAEPSSLAQTTKVIVKGALGLLSSAADGISIPGAKAIFDTIIKVIGVIEVRNVMSLSAKMG